MPFVTLRIRVRVQWLTRLELNFIPSLTLEVMNEDE